MQRSSMDSNHHKIIIIGAGITGLSTGLAWSKVFDCHEQSALIIEKQPVPGGCVATFARQGFRFDTVQIIPDVSDVMNFFGIQVELLKFDHIYTRLFLAEPNSSKVRQFDIPAGYHGIVKMLSEKYPEDGIQIQKFFNYCEKMHAELRYLKTEPAWYELPGILYHCPKIIANSGKTYEQFLRKFRFNHPDVYEILDVFSSFSGLSGNRCASLLTACAMVTTLRGSYRPVKGFLQFPLMLQKEFQNRGGEIRFNTTVRKILTDGNKASGVELDDGSRLYSDYVVSTADTQLTFERLLGYDVLKKAGKAYSKKAYEAEMSPSGIAIHLGLDDGIDLKGMGFDCGYNVLTTGMKTHQLMFDEWEKGNLLMSDEHFHFGVISPSAMIGGKQTLIIHIVPVSANYWIELRERNYEEYSNEKRRIADFYIGKTEEFLIPGLREHILMTDISTPATYARYIGSPTGSNFDMMPVPRNFGKNRLKGRTPVNNLFLPKFSHGIWPSMQAGLQVVDMISGGKIMNGNASYFRKSAK